MKESTLQRLAIQIQASARVLKHGELICPEGASGSLFIIGAGMATAHSLKRGRKERTLSEARPALLGSWDKFQWPSQTRMRQCSC